MLGARDLYELFVQYPLVVSWVATALLVVVSANVVISSWHWCKFPAFGIATLLVFLLFFNTLPAPLRAPAVQQLIDNAQATAFQWLSQPAGAALPPPPPLPALPALPPVPALRRLAPPRVQDAPDREDDEEAGRDWD